MSNSNNLTNSNEPKPRPINDREVNSLMDAVLVKGENRRQFKALYKEHHLCLKPLNQIEDGLIEEMVTSHWRLRRTWLVESDLVNKAMSGVPSRGQVPADPTVIPYESDDDNIPTNRKATANAYDVLLEKAKFKNLSHLENRLHRAYHRSMRSLQLNRAGGK